MVEKLIKKKNYVDRMQNIQGAAGIQERLFIKDVTVMFTLKKQQVHIFLKNLYVLP